MPFLGAYLFNLATARKDLRGDNVSIPKVDTFRKRLLRNEIKSHFA